MLNFCRTYLKFRVLVVVLFLIAAAIGFWATSQVKINYNMIDYLPDDAVSVQALHKMQDVFGEGIPNARLYAEGITQTEADILATKLGEIDGISDVMWLGTQVDLKQPIAVADPDLVDNWKSDDGYLYQLTISDDGADKVAAAVRALGDEVGASRMSLGGSAIDIADAETSTAVEIVYILIAAVIIVIVILGLTSSSWFEPVIFLVVIGVAISLNMGTNLIRGEICFITQICGAVLQLAVSMDYAIVMLHTFRRQQRVFSDPEEAMAQAMVKGFSVIISSAAVTFFGFMSLAVMRFQVGFDMGLVLSKGIAFSFFSIMFFMPCLILCCLKPLDKLAHRSLVPPFDKFALVCQKLMVPMTIIVILITPIAYMAQQNNSWQYGASNFAAPDSETRIEADRINDAFGYNETWVVMVPVGQWANEQALIDELDSLDMISGVTSYITVAGRAMPVDIAATAQPSTVEQVIKDGWSRLVLSTEITGENQQAFDLVETVRDICHKYYGDDYGLIGTQVSVSDLKEVCTADSTRVRLFSAVAIGIVLLIMFRSISIPLITLFAIEIAITINMACAYFTGTTIHYIGYLVIDAVQMGAAVDYAIIYEREYFDRRQLYLPKEAARSAIKHSALTILTSALILTFAGFAVSKISSNQIIAGIGVLIGRGAFVSMLMMFIFLPGLFVAFDWVIRHTTIHMKYLRKGETPPTPESIGLIPEEPRQPSKRKQRKLEALAQAKIAEIKAAKADENAGGAKGDTESAVGDKNAGTQGGTQSGTPGTGAATAQASEKPADESSTGENSAQKSSAKPSTVESATSASSVVVTSESAEPVSSWDQVNRRISPNNRAASSKTSAERIIASMTEAANKANKTNTTDTATDQGDDASQAGEQPKSGS